MFSPRPASAPRASTAVVMEQELLRKIGLLADHHARNVEALHRLRKSAWTAGGEVRRTGVSQDDSKMFCAPPVAPRRTFTRVVASAEGSWKRTPTVVEPFRSMETHTTAWKRKMRKYEELELQKKKDEEETRTKDRARFIAAINSGKEFSGVIARSHDMMKRRRQRIVDAEEQEEEHRRIREFKARPLHITDEDWQTLQKRQTVRRKQRNQMRKQMARETQLLLSQMSSMSRLPRRMAMHELQRKAAAARATTTTADEQERHTTRPRSCASPERIRQVLSRRQQRWDKQLLAAKRSKKPVVPQVLPMEEREKTYRLRARERAQREQEKIQLARHRLDEEVRRRREKAACSAEVPVVPRATYKSLSQTVQVRERLKKEADCLEREKRKEKARHARQQKTGQALAEVMRRIDLEQGRLVRRDTGKDAQQKARESRERYRQALRENQSKLEQATRHAPTLWERHNAELRKEEAKRIALSTIAERVLGSTSTGKDRENWRGSAAEKLFDEEECALLGLASY